MRRLPASARNVPFLAGTFRKGTVVVRFIARFASWNSIARWTLVFAAVFGLALAAAGCNTPNPQPTAGVTPTGRASTATLYRTPTASSTPKPTATDVPAYLSVRSADLNGLELDVWHGFRDETQARFDELAAAFNDENAFGLIVNPVGAISDGNLNNQVLGVLTEVDQPNLIFSTLDYFRSWQQKQLYFAPLDDYFAHPEYGLLADDAATLAERFPVSGKRTIFPLWFNPYVLFYNDTFGQQLGFDAPPETFAEFQAQSCAAFEARRSDDNKDNDGTGGWILNFAPGTVVSWLSALSDGATDYADLTSDAMADIFIENVTLMRGLFDDGCIWQSRLREPYDYFANHEALFYSGTAADLPFQRMAFQDHETNTADDWRMIPYPGMSAGRKFVFAETVAAGIVVATPEEQFGSWLFLQWLLSEGRLDSWRAEALGFPILSGAAPKSSRDRKISAALHDGIFPVSYALPADWITIKAVLADGFAFAFGAGATIESPPVIWDQVLQTIKEIQELGY